jgi:hypothetical protein
MAVSRVCRLGAPGRERTRMWVRDSRVRGLSLQMEACRACCAERASVQATKRRLGVVDEHGKKRASTKWAMSKKNVLRV